MQLSPPLTRIFIQQPPPHTYTPSHPLLVTPFPPLSAKRKRFNRSRIAQWKSNRPFQSRESLVDVSSILTSALFLFFHQTIPNPSDKHNPCSFINALCMPLDDRSVLFWGLQSYVSIPPLHNPIDATIPIHNSFRRFLISNPRVHQTTDSTWNPFHIRIPITRRSLSDMG